MFGFVKKVFAIVLLFWNKTVFSYYDLCYFCHNNKEQIKYVRIYPSVRNYMGPLYSCLGQTSPVIEK